MRAYSLKKADEPHQKASGEAWEIHEFASFPLTPETRKAADAERAKSDAAARIKWAEQQKLEAERQPLFDECMRRLKDAPTPPGRPSDWKELECWAHSFNVPSTPAKK